MFGLGRKQPATSLDAFRSRPQWRDLPLASLTALADRVTEVEDALLLMTVCEHGGFYQNVLANEEVSADPFLFGTLATFLTSAGDAMGDKGKAQVARDLFELAITIKPTHVPAWAGLALACQNLGDLKAARQWATKFLTWQPSDGPKDYWDVGASEARQDDGWAVVERQMRQILCAAEHQH